MLFERFDRIEKSLTDDFCPFPKYKEAGWERIPAADAQAIIAAAEKLAEEPYVILPAVRYMDFVKNGDRSRYQAVYFARRAKLICLAAAECIEQKGRFLDEIINGIWAICEESTWAIPAHLRLDKGEGHALVDVETDCPMVDLFAAETGAQLALILYLLEEPLNENCLDITKRMRYEIDRRLLKPYMENNDYSWMGFSEFKNVNNWNPWINENILTIALTMLKDRNRKLDILKKVTRSLDVFLDGYAEDGGCDEGASYFTAAGASLLDCTEQLYRVTNGSFSIYDEKLIYNMFDYIRKVYIGKDYFVNFADCPARVTDIAEFSLLNAAERTENKALADFASARLKRSGFGASKYFVGNTAYHYFRNFSSLLKKKELSEATYTSAQNGDYFPGIQVTVARSERLFLAAKGGHNNESHNHNDIGSYILYADGEPCIVDAGVGTYRAQTFNEHRYEIWSMQSGWHNTAIINNCDQHNGAEYRASDVSRSDNGTILRFALNTEKAYTEEAGLLACRREFTFDRNINAVTVHDCIRLSECREPVRLPVICLEKPEMGEGRIRIGAVTLSYDAEAFTAECEYKPFEDEHLENSWQRDGLYRILLTRKALCTEDDWKLTYTI